MQHIHGPARLLAALGNEHRLAIVELLRAGERCVCEITPAFELDPSVVSRHLGVLERAGVIRSRRDGRRIFYRVADRRALRIVDAAGAPHKTPAGKPGRHRVAAPACCPQNARSADNA